ncbi:MAG: hypothetical protein ACI97A_002801, partial [Planctomycetota bacterium]
MRPSIRLSLGFGLIALLLIIGLVLRTPNGAKQVDQAEVDFAKVEEVISRPGFDRMKPIHRKMLAHIVEHNTKSQKPLVAACWDTTAGDQETIDAFNSAITAGLSTGTEFQLGNRWSTTAFNGGGLGQGSTCTITVSFVPDGTIIPSGTGEPSGPSDLFAWMNGIYGSPAVWQQIFIDEFLRWAGTNGVNYLLEANDDGVQLSSASGQLGVRGDVRIGAKFIDGNSNVLAYNSFPNNGDMVLDSADSFYTNTNSNSIRLRNVVSHEHGHGLGMFHVCPSNGTKLMEPFINTGFTGPQLDDILNGQRQYGDDMEPNDTVAAATDLGTLTNGITTVTQVSTDDNSDTDVYKFTTTSTQTVNVTLRPTGTSYTEGPQTSQCNGGSTYDSLTVSDLGIEFLDSNGVTVLASANVFPAGQNELIGGVDLFNTGTFYVRVNPDSTNSVQAYELDIQLLAFNPDPISIEFPDGIPAAIDAEYVNHLRVDTSNSTLVPDPANSYVYVRIDGGPFIQLPMIDQTNDIWWANLPPADCYSTVDFYIEMNPVGGGGAVLSPNGAPGNFHSVDVLQRNSVQIFDDDFETDQGWTILDDAGVTGGTWERAIPSGDGTRGDPVVDADSSGNCYLTENGAGNTDVDGGLTRLFSPAIDVSGFGSARLKYSFWYSNDAGGNPNQDPFDVHVRESAAAPWVLVESYNANANAWLDRSIVITDFINLTSTFQVRFRAEDTGGGSVVEAGVDSVVIDACPVANGIGPNADGSIGVHLGSPQKILLVNGLGGGDDKEVEIGVGAPYTVRLNNPPGSPGADYAVF